MLSAGFGFPHASPAFQVEFVIVCLSEMKVDSNRHCWAELLMMGGAVKSWHVYGVSGESAWGVLTALWDRCCARGCFT